MIIQVMIIISFLRHNGATEEIDYVKCSLDNEWHCQKVARWEFIFMFH